MDIQKHTGLLQILCVVLFLYSENISALQLNYGLGYGVRYSDNITRTSVDEISGTAHSVNLLADIKHKSDIIDFRFVPRIDYYNYKPPELEDTTLYALDSALLWEIVKSRLSWSIDDYVAQTAIDVTAADTTFNKQTTNVFITGPDLKYEFGYGKSLVFLLRYADFYYEIDDTVDNERVGGLFRYINQFNPTSNYSLNISAADVRYKDKTVNEDYNRNDIFLGIERKTNRYKFNIDLGYSIINRDFSDDLDGQLVNLSLDVNLNNKSSLRILGRSEYTDSSRSFLLSRYFPEELRRFSTAITGEILSEDSLLAGYRWGDLATSIDFEVSHTDQDYVDDTAVGLDRTLKFAGLRFTRRATKLTDVFINVSWSNSYYKTTFIEDDDQLYTIGTNYRLSRSLFLRLDYTFANRESTDITGNYTENSVFAGISFHR